MKNAVDQFLSAKGLHPDILDLSDRAENFQMQMQAGLRKEHSSLLMLPTYLSANGEIPKNVPVLAIDAGGTNFRAASVCFTHEGMKIDALVTRPMPGTGGPIEKNAFLEAIADIIEPLLHYSDRIGFCFSYPAEIQPDRDGRLVKLTKEVQVEGAEGMLLCRELSRVLQKRGHQKRFVLLNDTVAALLGGYESPEGVCYDGLIGQILGTGANACYMETGEMAGKKWSGGMIVNMESGGYDGFILGETDRAFDSRTENPGQNLFEKMVAGRYLGGIVYEAAKEAGKYDLFSAGFTRALKTGPVFSTAETDEFCRRPFGNGRLALLCQNSRDRENLYLITDRLIQRAAKMVTATFAGTMEKGQMGKSPVAPACVVVEGSTFYKFLLFQDWIKYYARQFIQNELGRSLVFVHAENAVLRGAAVAALLNIE